MHLATHTYANANHSNSPSGPFIHTFKYSWPEFQACQTFK